MQAAGEHLPLSDATVDVTGIFGNIVSFAVDDGPLLVREVARVTRSDGLLLVEFPQVVGSLQEALLAWSRRRTLRRVLRDPEYYYLNQVLRTGYQPHSPERFCQWEFKFYTVLEARDLLAQAGFRTVDVMSVGPLSAY